MTDTLESLRKKIDGATDLAAVVRTMKALAAANIAQFESAVQSLQDYYRTLELGLAVCAKHLETRALETAASYSTGNPSQPKNVVVFGSDQGLVGRFNDALAEFVVHEFQQPKAGHPTLRIWVVGERLRGRCADLGLPSDRVFTVPTSVNAITPLITALLEAWEAQTASGVGPELHVVHNRPVGGIAYAPARQRLLPLDAKWWMNKAAVQWPTKQPPELAPSGAMPLVAMTYHYLFAGLFKACAESLASENASRLAAMQRAERNIREVLDNLTLAFNRLRQSSIDAELFDVLSGYELLDKTAANNGRKNFA